MPANPATSRVSDSPLGRRFGPFAPARAPGAAPPWSRRNARPHRRSSAPTPAVPPINSADTADEPAIDLQAPLVIRGRTRVPPQLIIGAVAGAVMLASIVVSWRTSHSDAAAPAGASSHIPVSPPPGGSPGLRDRDREALPVSVRVGQP